MKNSINDKRIIITIKLEKARKDTKENYSSDIMKQKDLILAQDIKLKYKNIQIDENIKI